MSTMRKSVVLGLLLLLGAAACQDLDVVNPNEPDAQRALRTAGDVESLIAGSLIQWFIAEQMYDRPGILFSGASFQHSQWPANFGQVFYTTIPRPSVVNNSADAFYANWADAWSQNYKAIAATSQGLKALGTPDIAAELGAQRVQRAKAFGKYVLGVAHASLALVFDKGFIVDETVDVAQPLQAVPYNQLMQKALGYLTEAVSLAGQGTFTIPKDWIGTEMSSAQLARVASSLKARYRAAIARTPTERSAVDWNAVLSDISKGITGTANIEGEWFDLELDKWGDGIYALMPLSAWQQTSYFIAGMADQSGNYQRWLSKPVSSRLPDLDGKPILIVTPDLRFPRGSTLTEQQKSAIKPGAGTPPMFQIPHYALGNNWRRPDRGTWRWSYYRSTVADHRLLGDPKFPFIRIEEMDLLAAEAYYRQNNRARAAELVNKTRVKNGLNATNANGTNTSCVPKLPNGQCGDLLEMLKWEKRLETQYVGPYGAPWYFDGRGWGDLYFGTYLQFPMPCREVEVLNLLPCATYGGPGAPLSSPGSVYAWPGEK